MKTKAQAITKGLILSGLFLFLAYYLLSNPFMGYFSLHFAAAFILLGLFSPFFTFDLFADRIRKAVKDINHDIEFGFIKNKTQLNKAYNIAAKKYSINVAEIKKAHLLTIKK